MLNNDNNGKVLLITGFSPISLPRIKAMGISLEPLKVILLQLGKDSIRFSIPTVGPASIAAYLLQQGINTRIIDYYLNKLDCRNSEIIGISTTFMGLEEIQSIAADVRCQNKRATIVLGGPLSWSLPPAQIFEEVPGLDYIVIGEGEQTFLDLVQAIKSGEETRSIPGVVTRDDSTISENHHRPTLDIGSLPTPAWDLLEIPSPQRLPVLPVETSRGCPFHCAYCSEVNYWGKPVRYRSPHAVAEEIKRNVTQYGINTFRFTDSCFSAPPARAARVCDAIFNMCCDEGIHIKWTAYSRVRNLTPYMLEKMKRSGCVALDIGMEFRSSSVLKNMGRDYKPETAVSVAKAARETGIITNFNMVIGFPGDTSDTLQETTELIEKAGPDTYSSFPLNLEPDSDTYLNQHRFKLFGHGLTREHDSMNGKARKALAQMSTDIKNSVNLPGGEYISCYLSSVGYDDKAIQEFFKAVGRLSRSRNDEKAAEIIKTVMGKIAKYF